MSIVWTNGCFDILHIGHIELLRYAKSLGDQLIVGIDSDSRVKELKGTKRPINNQFRRKLFLESIKYVDQVVIFNNESDLRFNIKNLSVDLIVVGDDYKNKRVVGSEYARVVFFPKIPNLSSSAIINAN